MNLDCRSHGRKSSVFTNVFREHLYYTITYRICIKIKRCQIDSRCSKDKMLRCVKDGLPSLLKTWFSDNKVSKTDLIQVNKVYNQTI